ncbi:MAG: hypothetical protein V3T86_11875 [Planctomycetota bacterium]
MTDKNQLVETVERLENSLTAEIAAERRAVWATRLIAGAFLVITCVFVTTIYVHFKGEFTEEKLAESVAREWEEMRPAVSYEIRTLSKNVLPVYGAEFRKQLPEMAPEVGRVLRKQTQRFADDMREDASGRVEATMQNAAKYTADEMYRCYPDLGPKDQKELMQHHRDLLRKSVEDTLIRFNERFSSQAVEFQTAALNVPPSDLSTRELVKKFAGLWIEWLGLEVKKL